MIAIVDVDGLVLNIRTSATAMLTDTLLSFCEYLYANKKENTLDVNAKYLDLDSRFQMLYEHTDISSCGAPTQKDLPVDFFFF